MQSTLDLACLRNSKTHSWIYSSTRHPCLQNCFSMNCASNAGPIILIPPKKPFCQFKNDYLLRAVRNSARLKPSCEERSILDFRSCSPHHTKRVQKCG